MMKVLCSFLIIPYENPYLKILCGKSISFTPLLAEVENQAKEINVKAKP